MKRDAAKLKAPQGGMEGWPRTRMKPVCTGAESVADESTTVTVIAIVPISSMLQRKRTHRQVQQDGERQTGNFAERAGGRSSSEARTGRL